MAENLDSHSDEFEDLKKFNENLTSEIRDSLEKQSKASRKLSKKGVDSVAKNVDRRVKKNFTKFAIEAILFTSGKSMSIDSIINILKNHDIVISTSKALKYLEDLKREYDEFNHSLKIFEDSDGWRMVVRDSYIPLISEMTYDSDFSHSLLETLAVITWKAPVLQSDVVEIRNNKAYDHLKLLEKKGFITREKFGKSYLIKLTDKFFDYFDIDSKKDFKKYFRERLKKFDEEMKRKSVEKNIKSEVESVDDFLKEGNNKSEEMVPIGKSGVQAIVEISKKAKHDNRVSSDKEEITANDKPDFDPESSAFLSGELREDSIVSHKKNPSQPLTSPVKMNATISLENKEDSKQKDSARENKNLPNKSNSTESKNMWEGDDKSFIDVLNDDKDINLLDKDVSTDDFVDSDDDSKESDIFNNPMLDNQGKKILDEMEKKSDSEQLKKVVHSVEDIMSSAGSDNDDSDNK